VVIQVLVAERDADHSLADQRAHLVLDQVAIPVIDEAGGKPVEQTDCLVRRSE